jgi:hypothetical protein
MSTVGGSQLLEDAVEEWHTLTEQLPEHEAVVRLGVVFGESYILVHVECHNMLEPAEIWISTMRDQSRGE